MFLLLLVLSDGADCKKLIWLFERYHDEMLRYARSLLRCFGDKDYEKNSEDAVQNAFVNIANAIDRIDTALPENVLGGYLMKTVRNEVFRFTEKRKKRCSSDEMLIICEECDYLEEFARKELYIKVVNEIDKLDAKYRDVLRMNLIENMSIQEIAKALGVPEKTVYTRRSRAIELIREKFKDEVI